MKNEVSIILLIERTFRNYASSGLEVSDIRRRSTGRCRRDPSCYHEGLLIRQAQFCISKWVAAHRRPRPRLVIPYGWARRIRICRGLWFCSKGVSGQGRRYYGQGFLPAAYQGTSFGRAGIHSQSEPSARDATEEQRDLLDTLRKMKRAATWIPESRFGAGGADARTNLRFGCDGRRRGFTM